MRAFAAGDPVQTPLGRGVVREVRNAGRLLVEVKGQSLVFRSAELSSDSAPRRAPASQPGSAASGMAVDRPRPAEAEIDLHGLTVVEALARTDEALSAALLADLPALRLIHGRSGGKIRAALHRHLRENPAVKGCRIDPRNDGVTIVSL